MTPQEEAYYTEMIRRLIQPPSGAEHPFTSAKDLGESGRRKPGASMFSAAEAAQNDIDDQSAANYAELDRAINAQKDPKLKMQLEAEKQRLLSKSVQTKPYTGDSGQSGVTINPAPPSGAFDEPIAPPQAGLPMAPTPPVAVNPMTGPPAVDPWGIPPGIDPRAVSAPPVAPAPPGPPQAVPPAPIAPSPPVAPAPPQAPVQPPVAPPAPIAPPVPPQGAMPAAGAVPGQPAPMGVSAPPPGGMDPWAAAGTQLDPKIAPGPPQTPEERDRRASGWRTFITKLQTDPNLQAMFLKMGTQLMQPVQPGQNAAGHVGAALQSGVDYAVQGSERKRKGDLEAGRAAREEKALTSDLASQKQGREIAGAQEARAKEKFKPELDALTVKIKGAKTEDEINQLALEAARFKFSKREEYSKAEMAKLDADTQESLAKSIYYKDYAGRGGKAGSTPDQNGAARALQALKATITTLQQEQNTANPGKKKSYERIKQEFLESNPGLATQWLKLEAAAGGAAMEDTPAAAGPDPKQVWTEEAMEAYLKGKKKPPKADAPKTKTRDDESIDRANDAIRGLN